VKQFLPVDVGIDESRGGHATVVVRRGAGRTAEPAVVS
jgi:hypothetical protein